MTGTTNRKSGLGQLQIARTGESGKVYRVQIGTDLERWTTVAVLTPAAGS